MSYGMAAYYGTVVQFFILSAFDKVIRTSDRSCLLSTVSAKEGERMRKRREKRGDKWKENVCETCV